VCAAANGEAGTWHTRVAYQIKVVTDPNVVRLTQAYVTAEQPARCQVGKDTIYCKPAGTSLGVGHIYATGSIHAGSRLDETYQKSAHAPGVASAGSLHVTTIPPRPSFVGQGVSTEVTISGFLQGVARSALQGGTARLGGVGAAQPIHTLAGDAARGDPFQIKLRFEPTPGEPSVPIKIGSSDRMREALNLPDGEVGLAMGGQFVGVSPTFGPDGQVSVCYALS
jgi:hypothetical protein